MANMHNSQYARLVDPLTEPKGNQERNKKYCTSNQYFLAAKYINYDVSLHIL